MYKHPFAIDPFAMVYTAFKNLWPELDCDIQWDEEISDSQGKLVFGVTTFLDNTRPDVRISPILTVFDAIEVLAHELAHVATNPFAEEHGKEWERAFDDILHEYKRICREAFPDASMQSKPEREEA